MPPEKPIFEAAGLKIDAERVLAYSRLSCPLDCAYCFVDAMNPNQKKSTAYLSEKQFELLGQLPEEVQLIMLGCDTEFFQQKRTAINVLEKLVALKKDLALITKLHLNKEYLKKIGEIAAKSRAQGNTFAFSVSIPCATSYKRWEPKAPSPEKRIETLRNAFDEDIMTMVAIRPLLPTVSEAELQKIVEETKQYTSGYFSGPLYLKSLDTGLFTPSEMAELTVKKIQPHWMLDKNEYYVLEKPGQMDYLKQLLAADGKPLFEGAAEGVKYLKQHEKHRTQS